MSIGDLLPFLIVMAGYTVLGFTGFGSALVIVPLLSWIWPLTTVVPLVLILGVLASGHLGLRHGAKARWIELARLAPTVLVGAIVGLYLSRVAQASAWPLALLGVYVAVVGVRGLRRSHALQPVSTAWAWPVGAVIGIIEVSFGTAGPPLVIYLTRRIADLQELRATLAVGILGTVLTSLTLLILDGRIAVLPAWPTLVGLAVAALLGVRLGDALSRRVDPQRVRMAVYLLLVLSGASLLARALTS